MQNNRGVKRKRIVVQASAVIMALTVILGGQTALAQAVTTTPSGFTQVAANVGGFEYDQASVDALNHLNNIRTQAGLSPVTLNPFLTKSASNHANYLATNNIRGHTEDPSKKGFTGAEVDSRIVAAGAGGTFEYVYMVEGISYGTSTISAGVDNLLNLPYHREALMDPNLTQLGAGISGTVVVFNYVIEGTTTLSVVYPYAGQQSVPLSFYGPSENPNPLRSLGITTSGYVITYKVANSPSSINATLKTSKGVNVPVFVQKSDLTTQVEEYGYQTWQIIPKAPLNKGETYTVTAGDKTWSFTTVGAATPKPPVSNEQPPRKFSAKDVGVRIDGRYVELSPKAQVLSNSTFIPLRGVFEAMGATIKWLPVPTKDLKGSEIRITKDDITIKLFIGVKQALVTKDGKMTPVKLSTAPYVTPAGTTYVPLRFASEALGAKVGWDAKNFIATIDQQ